LFCEDAGHEAFARAAVELVAREQGVDVSIGVASSRAGLGFMQRELRAYAETVRHRSGTPDLLVVIADGNAVGPNARRSEIEELELGQIFPIWIIGTPDPCVEAWLLADPASLKAAFGNSPTPSVPKTSDELKRYLRNYLEDAGEIITQGGVEFADEIVVAMDIYRAGKKEPTLKRFFDDLRAALK
jgi:hypothetical protein